MGSAPFEGNSSFDVIKPQHSLFGEACLQARQFCMCCPLTEMLLIWG